MKIGLAIIFAVFFAIQGSAQKKPLDHSVYDQWQNIGERLLSADGKFLAFVVNQQEGDGELVIRAVDGSFEKHIPRAFQVTISDDSRFLVARIKPFFKDTRQARIKKTAAADMPKDSLLIMELGTDNIQKISGIKSYKMAERGQPWIAVHLHKMPDVQVRDQQDSLARINRLLAKADSLSKLADSLRNKVAAAKEHGLVILTDKNKTAKNDDAGEEGTDLLVKNLLTGAESKFVLVSEYIFSKKGNVLVVETTRKKTNALLPATIFWYNLDIQKTDTVMKAFQDARNFSITENGNRLAFLAERDSLPKALKKYYKLWYYQPGMDSAKITVGPFVTNGLNSLILQPEFANYFSKDGTRLFVGLSPLPMVKDTSLVDFETAKLDLWNYQDDYLQPQQLVQLNNALKSSWLAVIDQQSGKLIQLGNDSCEMVYPSQEGNGSYALGISTKGNRIQQQWTQHTIGNLFLIDLKTGDHKLIAKQVNASSAGISPGGAFIFWYDLPKKQWMAYSVRQQTLKVLSKSIPYAVFDEEDDHPDDPPAYGIMGWMENDQFAYVYDRYDIWSCDPLGIKPAVLLTAGSGRVNQIRIRYEKTNPEEKYLLNSQEILLKFFDEKTKGEGIQVYKMGEPFHFSRPLNDIITGARFDNIVKARDARILIYRRQEPSALNLYQAALDAVDDYKKALQVSQLNPQQASYNWFSVELRRWKMFNGKWSEGLLYKPEDFDSTKKYPVILYFYERNTDNRFNYIEPMPVRASINIAWYTSNGYLVFDPNIYYTTGQPGEDAYNSVVSAASYLAGFKWVNRNRMGLQGHSWGGYQVAYLVTRTNLFAAAEAGAPVSNMTSAYGGIRWGTGISRQFQYEKSQSRLGTTLWEKPELFIKNSPLFRADKIKTPLLLLHNDKDDAVPWYQGIELFTALRRLGKPVWMASYNDELHGIIERRNRKDWTIRMAQFFDHYLMDKPSPRWMKDGIPAKLKGIDWGLDF